MHLYKLQHPGKLKHSLVPHLIPYLIFLCHNTALTSGNIRQLIDDQNYSSALNFFDKF